MDRLSRTDIAYVAGILDALGTFRVRETPDGTRLPYIAVSCPNTALLAHLSDLTGVAAFITRRTYDRHRCTEHCHEAHQHVTSRSARWSISGAKATVILAAIEPYLRFQKTEVADLLAVGLEAPRKSATARKMSALGWPDPWQAAA